MTAYYSIRNNVLYYENKICVPRKNVRDILHLAHDSQVSWHFGYSMTLSHVGRYHQKGKHQDVFAYCRRCTVCQRNNDSNTKLLGEHQPFEIPARRGGSVSIGFFTHMPATPRGFDIITTLVYIFAKLMRLVPSKGTDSEAEFTDCFFNHLFSHHGLPDYIVSDRDPKFASKFWKHLINL